MAISWDIIEDDSPLPLSMILLLTITAFWVAFFVFTAVRRLKHALSATTNVVVSKKLQHVQVWLYSYLHTITYFTTVFMTVSFITHGFKISAIFMVILLFVSTLVYTEIDVVGTAGRKPGINDFSPLVFAQYVTSTYLAKAVWKTSGHPHHADRYTDAPDGVYSSAMEILTLGKGPISNSITPRVYDVKDVVGIQGAYLSLPAIAIYFMTFLRPGTDEPPTFFSSNNVLFIIAGVLGGVSAIMPPLLGDWEYFSHDANYGTVKTTLYSLLEVLVRSAELFARVGMYILLLDVTSYAGVAMLIVEWFFMYATYVSTQDAPIGGRVYALSHHLLSSFESVFFAFYRRISVDKQFVTHGNFMTHSIELFRFIVRTATTVIGFALVLSANDDQGRIAETIMFISLVCAILSTLANLVQFFTGRKNLAIGSEAKRLFNYWKQWWCCRTFCCCPTTAYVNRDKNIGGTPGNNFNYI